MPATKRATRKKSVKKQVKRTENPRIREERASSEGKSWDNMDVHEVIANKKESFGPLPNIPPRPGMQQRWVRYMIGGEMDWQNLSKRDNEGWVRRVPNTVKGLPPTRQIDRVGECIVASGNILMEMPDELYEIDKSRVADKTRTQTEAVEKSLFKDTASDGFGAAQAVENNTGVTVGRMPVDD